MRDNSRVPVVEGARSHEIRLCYCPFTLSLSLSSRLALLLLVRFFVCLPVSVSVSLSLTVCLSVFFFPCGCYISDWWLLTRYSLGITNDLAVISRDACISLSLCNDGTGHLRLRQSLVNVIANELRIRSRSISTLCENGSESAGKYVDTPSSFERAS